MNQTTPLSRAILRKFLMLGTPISSHRHSLWAISTSSRVGATSNCIQRFEELNSSVLSTLITTWSPRLSRWLVMQFSWNIRPRSPRVFHESLNKTAAIILITNTAPAMAQHERSRTSRRERKSRHVWALGLFGSVSGNHGEIVLLMQIEHWMTFEIVLKIELRNHDFVRLVRNYRSRG